jgi:hypothetical protein
MALQVKAGQITQPTSTGNAAFTGVGFVPKVIILFASDKTADGSAINNALYRGMATSTSNRIALAGVATQYGTEVNDRYANSGKCFVIVTTANAILVSADLVSFDADGFTLNFDTVDATARKINYIALGGSDITNVKILKFTQNAGTGSQGVTGMGFKADSLIMMSSSTTADPGGDTASGGDVITGIGTAANAAAVSADSDETMQIVGDIINRPTGGDGTIRYEATLTSIDSDGFTVNWSTASARDVWALGIKGGAI